MKHETKGYYISKTGAAPIAKQPLHYLIKKASPMMQLT